MFTYNFDVIVNMSGGAEEKFEIPNAIVKSNMTPNEIKHHMIDIIKEGVKDGIIIFYTKNESICLNPKAIKAIRIFNWR